MRRVERIRNEEVKVKYIIQLGVAEKVEYGMLRLFGQVRWSSEKSVQEQVKGLYG